LHDSQHRSIPQARNREIYFVCYFVDSNSMIVNSITIVTQPL
jgi:hypothetical protein